MSEMIWTNVKVVVPSAWLPEGADLPGVLGGLADYLGEGYNEPDVDEAHGATTLSFAGESNYGLCGVQEWCDEFERLGIPFEASDEPKYEFEGETVYFDGQRYFHARTGGEGEQLLDFALWKQIAAGEHDWAPDVESYFTKMPGINSASIEHLLGRPSPFVEAT